MKGLLAAMLVLVAGCPFNPPTASDQGMGDAAPNGGTDGGGGGDATPRCQGYDYEDGGHHYRMTRTAMSWAVAKASCEADGGYLLKFETMLEDDRAAELINFPDEVWIGLNDADQDGTYVWTDGSSPAFAHWSGTGATPAPGSCIIKNTRVAEGRWHPRSCNDPKVAVCECVP